MRTEVAIIGGGPAGLLLSQLLNRAGVDTVILERVSRDHVLSRIRAGVLEAGTVDLLRSAGVSARLDREALIHDGVVLSDGERMVHIDFRALTGSSMTIYGQTEMTADLYAAQDAMGTPILHEASDVEIDDLDQENSVVRFHHGGDTKHLRCRFVAGCDGFHGVSRRTIPVGKRREFERTYPFGWLGVLAKVPPCHDELIYATSARGFALASMRSKTLSRYYIQVPIKDRAEDWSDAAFWSELTRRLPPGPAEALTTGLAVEKSIAPLRSFVSEPLRWGNLVLAGDAAHIVPPTGAKGLNLAVSDVFYLHEALIGALKRGDMAGIESYSDRALRRIWKAMRFSWQMTMMLHRFEGEDSFAAAMRGAMLEHQQTSETARRELAENYVGLPF
ncbi:MAG: 4-hydroxybenzoate 3-monooxygenase [Silicimonas sp.]|nr:4-hydroxybenzoate 3-monooxygenase [Silicimonas sp.]